MATGITYPIKDGKPITFERFLWTCARMMMPLILMRDEPIEALPPEEFKPLIAPYDDRLNFLRQELASLEEMSEAAAIAAAQAQYEEAVARMKAWNQEAIALRYRYEAMLALVDNWNPPTADHAGLKAFMREQLLDSIRHDCSQSELPVPPRFSEWRNDRLAHLKREIAYSQKQIDEEIQRTTWRNAWLKVLRESVPYPTDREASAEAQS